MNEEVCKKCRRYAERPDCVKSGWMCADSILIQPSYVIPGFKILQRLSFVQVLESMCPPEWCERPLEHIVTEPGEKVDGIRRDERLIEYDGNTAADWHIQRRIKPW